MSKEVLLTSYKVNKNLTIEAREENSKNTLFVNGKVYVFDKIDEDNLFFSKEEKKTRNALIDNIQNTNITFYLEGKRPLLIRCDFDADIENSIGCIINRSCSIYLDQYDIETFLGLPTQKNIRRLIAEYRCYTSHYSGIHCSFADICIRAALIYIKNNIDLSLKNIPSVPNTNIISKNRTNPDNACSVEEQDKYIKDILAKATNDLEKQLFSITTRIILLRLFSTDSKKLKSIELASDEFIKNELKTCQNVENIFANLIADMQDFASKALQSEQFKHLKYRDIGYVFCAMRNNGSVEFYDTFKAEDLCNTPNLLLKSINNYLDEIRTVEGNINNIIDAHIESEIGLEKCRNRINEEVNNLQAMFKGIQYLIDIGCKLNNQGNECLENILIKLRNAESPRWCYESEEYCDSKLVFVECDIEPVKIVERHAINTKVKKSDRTDIAKKLTSHLLEFLLKAKVVNPDDGEEMSHYKTNDIRMLFMQARTRSDIKGYAIKFLTILGKYGFNLKQKHLDTLQATINEISNDVKQKAIEYKDMNDDTVENKSNSFKQGYYNYVCNIEYLEAVKPFLEFVKNNVR